MPRFSGRQYPGAMRDYRLELRVEAEARQAAEQARDAAREKERRRRARTVWNSRAGRAWTAHSSHIDSTATERRRA